jgi:hypothetical protein
MRASEDSSFFNVFFTPFTNQTPFTLSEGGGLKTVYAQFRSITGQTNPPVSVTVTYITAGPVIQTFNLTEGQVLSRPVTVTGSATAILGMSAVEFYVDNILQDSAVGGNYSKRFDVRTFAGGTHRVKLLARDTSGNIATLERNVAIVPTPPAAPVITTPGATITVGTPGIAVGGTAEPLIDVRLTRNGTVVGTRTADAGGNYNFNNAALIEGRNDFVAAAFDALGSASSPARVVLLDTGAPAPLIIDTPVYRPGAGLDVSWHFPPTGERATRFILFWHTTSFATTNDASGHTLLQSGMTYTAYGLANGTYYFGVIGYDDAGNPSPLSALVSYNYDANPPSFTVQYDRASPVGTGPLKVTLTANEPVSATPSLTIRPFGAGSPTMLSLTNTALSTWESAYNITVFTRSGVADVNVTAQDLAGNAFSGQPAGAPLIIDVVPPTGSVFTTPVGPVQATNSTNVNVVLTLSKTAKAGVPPALNFNPPLGAGVSVPLTGSGSNWSGTLTLTPAMGTGFGRFAMNATDAVGNVGTNINAGGALEIYNTTVPGAPALPRNLRAETLAGGKVKLTWDISTNAEIYRLYREPGTNGVPTVQVVDNLTNIVVTNLPPLDGQYRFAVTAARRGAESTNSNVVIATSDRTPPDAPTNVVVQLAAAGVQITWQQPSRGETPIRYKVYRNGVEITVRTAVTPVNDSPPRGVMTYAVAAVDSAGNEGLSVSASIELFVGAVNNLVVLVNIGQSPMLSWTSNDPTAIGFNIYRNGIKQNGTPQTTRDYTDLLPLSSAAVQYAVRAVNAIGQESAARVVDVYRVDLALAVNALAGGAPVTRYFDSFRTTVSNLTSGAGLPLAQVELQRTIQGSLPLVRTNIANLTVAEGNWLDRDVVLPGAALSAPQTLRLRAYQASDIGGSEVIYQRVFEFATVAMPVGMVDIVANQQPLAGGLAAFQVRVFNRGGAPLDLVTTRNNGSQPGDLYVSVKNADGLEVSRGNFNGVPPGTTFLDDGRGIVRLLPGASVEATVPNVLVPEALATNAAVTFEAVAGHIYYNAGSGNELESGPLNGSMSSALAQTEYFGTAQTDQPGYANEQPVIVSGQAVNRANGLPMANVPLKIGFASGGYRWFRDVTTDATGNYQYIYNPAPGLAGTLTIWAAHPLVFDTLNQARVTIYRLYPSPARGDIRMSKNDTINFSINLINPGEVNLTGFTASFRAYTMTGTNQTDITNITGRAVLPPGYGLGFKERRAVTFELTAAIDAPDNAVVEFRLTSAEGAVATFTANVTLLQAVPLVTVVRPSVGYVEVSVDRGSLVSREVTVVNRGLRDLLGVEIVPPTNATWMVVNLPRSADGKIHLPDLRIGESNSFSVVFAPPSGTLLGPTNDFVVIRGTNSPAEFRVNLFPLVTSAQKGAVQFYVDNILSQDVPNASVRLRNTQLQIELPPVYTESAGLVTVTNLQEGVWSWQISAPGHSANVGVAEIIPGQTVRVDTRLNKSVVTISFSVVPVPYTDKYEIKLEQTFETHVPVPVLVMTPAYREFNNVRPGFEVSYIVTAKNEGLIQMENLRIVGQQTAHASFTPLIDYVPVLLPQQEVEIPFKVVYWGTNAPSQQGNPLGDCLPGIPDFGYIGDFVDGLRAIANAEGRCVKDNSLLEIAGGIALGMKIFSDLTGMFASVAEQVASYIGCVIGSLLSNLGGFGGPAGGGSGPSQAATQNFARGGPACFEAGTLVSMADGRQRSIGELRPGDRVRTGTRPDDVASVSHVFKRRVETVRVVRFEEVGSAKPQQPVVTTDEHLFWVDGKGWTVANQLRPGDWLLTDVARRVKVADTIRETRTCEVYTLQLRGDSAFYAGGVLVHDMCGLDQANLTTVAAEVVP